jgi:hypothetical protein
MVSRSMMKSDWWKIPESFLYLIMNTGETKEVCQENINSEILDSIIGMGKRLFGHEVALPFPGDYRFSVTFDVSGAGFTIATPSQPLSHGYFSSTSDDWDAAWSCAEADYYSVTDKSAMEWSVPEKPESKPWLAVVRYNGDLRCSCEFCLGKEPEATLEHLPVWLGEMEKAVGLRLTKR